MMSDWLPFLAVTLVILIAGSKLSRYADVIADKTGAGRTLVGLALLAWITSLPELITGVSSVAFYDLPEIAVGDVLGSCMLNLLILVLVDFLNPGEAVFSTVRRTHGPAAVFGLSLLVLISAMLARPAWFPGLGWIGWNSVMAVPIWAVTLLRARRSVSVERLARSGGLGSSLYPFETLSRNVFLFLTFAVVTVLAATYLPLLAERIAETSGLGETFVGNIFVALSTSLPELVVCVGAMRIGAPDLAVANVLGSNLFNLVILAVDDLLFREGPLLDAVARTHIIPAVAGVGMTSIVLLGLRRESRKKRLALSYPAWGILGSYVLVMILLFIQR